jgi:DNA polymerase-1
LSLTASQNRILLVDGTNIVMRYAHAMASESVGEPDNPAFSGDRERVASACVKAIRECAKAALCGYAVVAFDSRDSWRKKLYPPYKAKRDVSTHRWSEALRSACNENKIFTVSCDSFEADDVIATLDRRVGERNMLRAVLSGDSDLLVLASDECDDYQFGRTGEQRFQRRSPEWICEKYGIASPQQLRAYKAIVGESGEGVPGLEGYGPVKARALIERWGSVDKLSESQALTEANRERLALMLALVTLRTDVPIGAISPSACRLPD